MGIMENHRERTLVNTMDLWNDLFASEPLFAFAILALLLLCAYGLGRFFASILSHEALDEEENDNVLLGVLEHYVPGKGIIERAPLYGDLPDWEFDPGGDSTLTFVTSPDGQQKTFVVGPGEFVTFQGGEPELEAKAVRSGGWIAYVIDHEGRAVYSESLRDPEKTIDTSDNSILSWGYDGRPLFIYASSGLGLAAIKERSRPRPHPE